MSIINLKVNGRTHTVDVDPQTSLLYVLRNDILAGGPLFGCGLGQCGACTVIIEGTAVRSCITPVDTVQTFEITTLSGLGTRDNPHPIQQAFIDKAAAQCGYCINGFVMEGKVFIDNNPKATDAEIKLALDANLCRCGTHTRILAALKQYQQGVQA
ncbi:MAG: (2Fe-2S)-binding protein [Acidobacteria bacterium]|nr:(2Fe-2S)-binding protein [Acidobacteriota bacterium]